MSKVQNKNSDFPVPPEGIGHVLRHLPSTDSTNRVAREWVAGAAGAAGGAGAGATRATLAAMVTGAPDGAVVLADTQEAGRGRLGRTWTSSPGQNLLFTVILKNREPLISNHEARGVLPLATSLAVADTIQSFIANGSVQIKWPNDVQVDGKKCAGILVESVADEAFLIGIGLNVNESDFSDDLVETATSLLLQDGRRKDRKAVYLHLVNALNKWLPRVFKDPKSILDVYIQRLAGIGNPVTLRTPQAQIHGTLVGIHDDGGLIVKSDGLSKVYYAGDVSLNQLD